MLSTESILFLFDRFEHKGGRVHRLLNGRKFTVLLEVDSTVSAQQDVFSATVVPVFGGSGEAVTTSVTLQLLFTVLAVKIIFTGRTQVQEFTGGGP